MFIPRPMSAPIGKPRRIVHVPEPGPVPTEAPPTPAPSPEREPVEPVRVPV